MHVIDLSYFVKIYRSKNKHISVNFLRHLHRAGDLHLSGTTRCIYEDVIMKKVPHTTDCHRPERNLSHGLCRATDE